MGSNWNVDENGNLTKMGRPPEQNVVVVAKSGVAFSTIQAAVDYVETQSPSNTNPWLIWIAPGIYQENVTISKDGISLFAPSYGSVRIENVGASDTVTIQDTVDPDFPWDIHLMNLQIRNDQATKAALKVQGLNKTPDTSFLGNELELRNVQLQNFSGGWAFDAELANYISGTWANWTGKVRVKNVAGQWFANVVNPATSVEIIYDPTDPIGEPSDSGNYGFFLQSAESVGAVTIPALGGNNAGKCIFESVRGIASITLNDTGKATLLNSKVNGNVVSPAGTTIESFGSDFGLGSTLAGTVTGIGRDIPRVIANAAARPASPAKGERLFQDDIAQLIMWNGTVWVIVA